MAASMPGGEDASPHPEESAVDAGPRDAAPVDWDALPGALRSRLAELAASALGDMRGSDVPAQLRPVIRFAPAKRAKLGQAALVGAFHESEVFRTAVVDWCRKNRPEALDVEGEDAVDVAVATLLLGKHAAAHYVELCDFRAEQGRLRRERDAAAGRSEKLEAEIRRLRADLEEARAATDRARDENTGEADRLRKRLREQGVRLREAKDAAEEARAELERVREEAASTVEEMAVQRDRERERARSEQGRAERARQEAELARQSAREARQADEVRLGLLLDTLEGAISGLRREIGSSSSGRRPADAVTGARAPSALTEDVPDVAALERLLALPAVHLIVDGYNVTKTGYPELPLADQRERLANQLAALASRTGAEVTVIFDGADVLSVPVAGPRGVRVLFSEPGVQADDVIRSLVAAEPAGRPLVVATSDREVVESVRPHGAHPVSSGLLLARISRV